MDNNSPGGVGQSLRLHRERRHISLDTISRATMIRRDYLELIDEDRLDRLPPGAYAKGFIRAYASHLGLDAAPLLKVYEQSCEQPAPELSAVVRQPVRVPNPVRPRTWRAAAAAGVAVLVLLGILGAVRSGDRTARPPTPSAAEVSALGAGPVATDQAGAPGPSANPAGAVVRVEVAGAEAWMQAEADGSTVFSGVLHRGERKVFRGTQRVYLVIGNATGVRIVANGRDAGSPPGSTYRGTFTPTTADLPPSEPH